jgi:cytochrome c
MVRILAAVRYIAFLFVAMQLVCTSSAEAAGDPTKGAQLFKRCAICHSIQLGGPNKIGPNLYGIMGRRAASLMDFMYSAALEMAGFVWTDDKLLSFIQRPQQVLPGTKMSFKGIPSPAEASDIVAYIESIK